MIGSTRQLRVFAFAAPVDLRNGFDGLWALASQQLGKDVLQGDLFLPSDNYFFPLATITFPHRV